jgi:hypothetical protein
LIFWEIIGAQTVKTASFSIQTTSFEFKLKIVDQSERDTSLQDACTNGVWYRPPRPQCGLYRLARAIDTTPHCTLLQLIHLGWHRPRCDRYRLAGGRYRCPLEPDLVGTLGQASFVYYSLYIYIVVTVDFLHYVSPFLIFKMLL